MTRGELELLTDIRNFTTLFYVIFRVLRLKFSEWLEFCIESDLGMPFAIWSLDFAFHDQLLSEQVIEKIVTLANSRDSGKRKFLYP